MNQQSNTALLVMDMQTVIVNMLEHSESILQNVAGAIVKARSKGIPVFFIRVGFRPGSPEVSPNNSAFSAHKDYFTAMGDAWKEIHPAIQPTATDIIITKRRVSAFTGSDLEVLLKGQQISHIILTGIATSGVVLSTLREAADKDYQITVLSDCCADRDQEVHQFLVSRIFPSQSTVLSLKDWL